VHGAAGSAAASRADINFLAVAPPRAQDVPCAERAATCVRVLAVLLSRRGAEHAREEEGEEGDSASARKRRCSGALSVA
jgi:hypothetical protein